MRLLTSFAIVFLVASAAPANAQEDSITFVGPHADSLQRVYRAWWKEITTCAGSPQLKLSSAVTQIVVVQAPFISLPDGVHAGAAFDLDVRDIWIAEPYLTDSIVVRHEMLHAVLEPQHIFGHPPRYFGDGSMCGVPITRPELTALITR